MTWQPPTDPESDPVYYDEYPQRDIPRSAFVLIILVVAVAVAFLVDSMQDKTSYDDVPKFEPSACIYLEKSYITGAISPENRDYYETYC